MADEVNLLDVRDGREADTVIVLAEYRADGAANNGEVKAVGHSGDGADEDVGLARCQ